jgi:hypothetical protein
MKWLKRLFGCSRRARANQLRVWQYRVDRAETAEELYDLADEAIHAGVIDDVQAMLDRKPLPAHEAIALSLYRGYWEGMA